MRMRLVAVRIVTFHRPAPIVGLSGNPNALRRVHPGCADAGGCGGPRLRADGNRASRTGWSKKVKVFKLLLLGLSVLLGSLLAWSLIEPYFIDTEEQVIEIPGLPTSWEGQRVGVVAGWQRSGNQMHVNCGIGFSVAPLRVNCMPEVTLFTLTTT